MSLASLTVQEREAVVEYQVMSILSRIITIYPNIPVNILIPERYKYGHFLSEFLPQLITEGERCGIKVAIHYSLMYPHRSSALLDRFIAYTAGWLKPEERTFFLTIITREGTTEDLVCSMNTLNMSVIRDRWPDALAAIFRIVVHSIDTPKAQKQEILLTLDD